MFSDHSDTSPVYGHPARILPQAATEQRATPTELLALASQAPHALDAAIFDSNPPFFWRALISNNTTDAYFTRMAPSSLRNYAADAEQGVAFQNSHNTRELPLGRSLTGTYVGAGGDGVAHVHADFYTLAGLNLSSVSSDELIRGIRAGIVRDVSIGFYNARFRCSACSRDMLRDFDCPHVPGDTFTPTDADGKPAAEQTVIAWVEDARLAEVSAVYDGATPGAGILKAYSLAESGRLRPDTTHLLEQRFRIRLPAATRVFPVAQPDKEDTVPPEKTPATEPNAELTARLGEIAAVLERAKAPTNVGLAWLAEEIERLRPLADDGRAYRSDLISAAMAEGVRALGPAFAADTYAPVLASAPLEAIKRMRDDWQAIADKALSGGRQIVPLPESGTARVGASGAHKV